MAKTEVLDDVCAMLDTYGGRDKVGIVTFSFQIFILSQMTIMFCLKDTFEN